MTNPFLEGSFAPIDHEYTDTALRVTGTIPDYLDGRYLRNGPNPLGDFAPETYHWFAGDGMVHGVRLEGGQARWYRNRWVRSPEVSRKLHEPTRRIGKRAGWDILGANTNVIGHAGKTLALIESGVASYELTDELDTVGTCDFDGTIHGGYTAHPKCDPETGELHAVSYSFGRGNRVEYSVIDTDGRARKTVDIEVTGSPMMHDFSLTENHVIFYDLPVTFDADQAAAATVPRPLRPAARLILSSLIGRVRVPDPITAASVRRQSGNSGFPYRWDAEYPARIGVMPREGGSDDVRWFDVEPCYVFHPLNAYDDVDGTVVLDVVRHPKVFDTELRGPAEGPPSLHRWTVDLSSGKVREERLDDRNQEFPRVDERLVGKRHRFGYTVSDDSLLKYDFTKSSTSSRSFGKGCNAGEFVFEPSSADADEEDGVLMGFVYDAATDRSDLQILDAATLDTVASVHLPTRVPAGFHGNWVPTA